MNNLYIIWNKFKQEPDIWFFYGFLLSFPFSIRKILFYFPIQRTFNEYTAVFVYVSDIFLFFTILSWFIIILCNNFISLSMFNLWITRLIHRLYEKIRLELKFLFKNNLPINPEIINHNSTQASSNKKIDKQNLTTLTDVILFFIPLIFVIFSFFSILWSQNQSIAVFRSIKLFELYILYFYIAFKIVPRGTKNFFTPSSLFSNVPHGTFENFTKWNNIFFIIITISIFQSIIGIFQFITQKSIGLFWLGESHISPNIPGVAKILFDGHILIRSYGIFPHPNIFGGFLLLSIVLSIIYKKSIHKPLLSNTIKFNRFSIILGKINLDFIIFIQLLALMLTFSKSAIVGLLIALFYIYIPNILGRNKMFHVEQKRVPRGTYSYNVAYSHKFRVIILVIFILITMVYILWSNFNLLLSKSLYERIFYLNVSRGTILSNPILGTGIGQFVINMPKYENNLELWQFQPVHNVFLLIWSELGMVGLGLFIYWIYKMFHVKQYIPFRFHKQGVQRVEEGWNFSQEIQNREVVNNDKSILENKYSYLSSFSTLHYFKALFFGIIFIMLFDHYFWDIQQGSIMLWTILGFIAGIGKN